VEVRVALDTNRLTDPDAKPGNRRQLRRLFVQLKRARTPIPDNDLWIAAMALQHDLLLITRDQHFERVPQLLRG